MFGSVYKRDGKKWVLIVVDLLFGLYLLNSKIPFLGSLNISSSLDSLLVFLGGILLLLNLLYLVFFARRI